MQKLHDSERILKGTHKTWGIWERLVPNLISDADPAGQRMMDIHLARYRTAESYVAQKRVLDIASGTGYGSRMLMDAGALSVTGVDLSQEAVTYAQENYQCDGLTFQTGNAEEFTTTEPFDVVTSFETIEHLPNPRVFLRRIRECLAPGGTLLISAPIGETRHIDGFHLHVFQQQDVFRMLAESGFLAMATRFDDWQVSMEEIMTWPKIYPDARLPFGTLLFTWRGRRVLRDLVFRRQIRMPMLLIAATRADNLPCEEMQQSRLDELAVQCCAEAVGSRL